MPVYDEVCRAIDSYREHIVATSHRIHGHPELKFEEHFACQQLSGALSDLGLAVETGIGGLATAFRAEFGQG
ncbi:MAG: hypothetical protein ACREQ4_03820, partial [Candidatus Binataceae bacterium]